MSTSEVASPIASENPPAQMHSVQRTENVNSTATPMASLRKLAVQGSLWTIFGHGLSEVIRFGGHLIIARLVVPEVFGIMALVTVFMTGLQMFSDIGIGPSVVQDKRGDDPKFLNTAWTIQIIRGTALTIATLALAYPFAQVYYAELFWLLPVAALGPFLSGFLSTSLASLHRRLSIGKLMIFELSLAVMRAAASIGFVLLLPDHAVLALIIANLLVELARLVISHTILGSDRNRLCWDQESASRLFRFGRWIFISTALTFFIGYGDKLILGTVFSEAELGIYVIAYFLSDAIVQALRRLAHMVLFPLYARLSDHGDGALRKEMLLIRSVLMALTLPPLWVLAVFGSDIVRMLYTEEYAAAGWILQLLAMGTIAKSMAVTLSPVLLSMGDSFRNMLLMITRTVFMFGGMWLGYSLAGTTGVIIGVAAASTLNYPVLAFFTKKYGVWMPWLDIGALTASALFIGGGLLLMGAPDMWGQLPAGGG